MNKPQGTKRQKRTVGPPLDQPLALGTEFPPHSLVQPVRGPARHVRSLKFLRREPVQPMREPVRPMRAPEFLPHDPVQPVHGPRQPVRDPEFPPHGLVRPVHGLEFLRHGPERPWPALRLEKLRPS